MIGRALVVEDDRSWQAILVELLEDAGLTADSADSLESALRLIRAGSHLVAVVDLSLVGKDHRNQDGLGVLDGLHRDDPGCAAILLSGFATVEVAVSALTEYGAFTVLEKEHFQRSQFRETLRRALEAARPPEDLAGLTSREREVLALLSQGLSNKDIAARLVISLNTVKRHVKAIYRKLEIHTRSAAAVRGTKEHLTDGE